MRPGVLHWSKRTGQGGPGRGTDVSIFGYGQVGADVLPRGMGCVVPLYRPRDAEHTVLHQVISEHLETFLNATTEAGDGVGLPQFVERELREFLLCGAFEGGVARFQCEGCGREHLVPFSCKGRGWCPSCGGRRMTERAAHLVDAVLPWVPVRQWVLTVPYRLRCRMAFDHGLSRAVLGVYARVLCDPYARGARALGGVLAFGIIGLFMGPVLLAVSYTLLVAWVDEDQAPAPES